MKYLTENKYWDLVKDYNLDKMLYLLIDRPYKINKWNELCWKDRRDEYYRGYNLPSIVYPTGIIIR